MSETATAPLTVPARLTSLVEGLMSDVAACVEWRWLEIPLIILLWRQLRRLKLRFAAILARDHAGLPARSRSSFASAKAGAPATPASRTPRPGPSAPRTPSEWTRGPRGWVAKCVSRAFFRAWALEEMLEEPELADLVAATPQLGRVLRPLCHMLAVKQPAWLRLPRLPRRPRRYVAKRHPPAPDWLVNEPGAILKPDGSVWMRFGSSTHWKPGSRLTLEQAQKLDWPRRIWPRED
jgi:hypothetical protein